MYCFLRNASCVLFVILRLLFCLYNIMQRARKRFLHLCFEDVEDQLVDFSVRRPRRFRERAEDFESLDDQDFIMRYNLTKPTVSSILGKIDHNLERETNRSVKFETIVSKRIQSIVIYSVLTGEPFPFFLSVPEGTLAGGFST